MVLLWASLGGSDCSHLWWWWTCLIFHRWLKCETHENVHIVLESRRIINVNGNHPCSSLGQGVPTILIIQSISEKSQSVHSGYDSGSQRQCFCMPGEQLTASETFCLLQPGGGECILIFIVGRRPGMLQTYWCIGHPQPQTKNYVTSNVNTCWDWWKLIDTENHIGNCMIISNYVILEEPYEMLMFSQFLFIEMVVSYISAYNLCNYRLYKINCSSNKYLHYKIHKIGSFRVYDNKYSFSIFILYPCGSFCTYLLSTALDCSWIWSLVEMPAIDLPARLYSVFFGMYRLLRGI